jgi:hypothetical protein
MIEVEKGPFLNVQFALNGITVLAWAFHSNIPIKMNV